MTTSTATTVGAANPEEDMAAVAAVPGRIVAAWANQDGDAFARVFTADGSMILPGLYLKGREDIRSYMTDAFAGHYQGTRVTGQPLDLRFLGRDAAVVTTQGGVLAAGQTEVSGGSAIRASWVVVRADGEWLLAAYQNSPRDPA
jgi:uncharacterized protein (TIGR02246 family)